MTTPLVPELPEVPGTARSAPGRGAGRHRAPDRTIERAAVLALLMLLGLALVLAAVSRVAPVVPLATAAALLLVAVAALGRAPAADRAAPPARPAADGTTCGLEDRSDVLRCHRPAGHPGAHYDERAGQAFEDTLAAHIGDAGAYYLDRQGRPVPIDDAF
ncbi:hypothetical protein ACT4S2_07755 [Kocuria turfanensis]|uniref:hypothetical protein n=1 Tax=Kocuria turfanensis TaxID=388357 RepID=UPI00403579C6